MKRLNEELPLKGQFEKITMMDLRSRPGEVFTSVEFGKTFLVTRAGKEIAVLSKVPGSRLTSVVDDKGKRSFKLEVSL